MGTLERLRTAERMEVLAARIYRLLAAQHQSDPETRGLFEKLAGEEDQHALRVRMVQRRYFSDSAVESVALDLPAAEALVHEAERLCDQLAARQTTAREARDLALRLEEAFALAHAETLTRDCPAEVRQFFEDLAAQDREHAKLLR